MSVPPGLTENCIAKSSMEKKKLDFLNKMNPQSWHTSEYTQKEKSLYLWCLEG